MPKDEPASIRERAPRAAPCSGTNPAMLAGDQNENGAFNMRAALERWLRARVDSTLWEWLEVQLARVSQPFADADLYIPFGLMPRKVGKAELALGDHERSAACAVHPEWHALGWNLADAARVLLLLCAAPHDRLSIMQRLNDLATHADIGESLSLSRGLAVYPDPRALIDFAAEAMRSNMRAVFNAVALNNPYPQAHFDQPRWNQLVLKALFMGSPLHRVIGLDARTNPDLAVMLYHFYMERRAAGREVSPELWRCLGPHATAAMCTDLGAIAFHPDRHQRQAAALALSVCPLPEAAPMLAVNAEHKHIVADELSWKSLSLELESAGNETP